MSVSIGEIQGRLFLDDQFTAPLHTIGQHVKASEQLFLNFGTTTEKMGAQLTKTADAGAHFGETAAQITAKTLALAKEQDVLKKVTDEVGAAMSSQAKDAQTLAGVAALVVSGIQSVGATSKVSADLMADANKVLQDAKDAYTELGEEVPTALHELQDELNNVGVATTAAAEAIGGAAGPVSHFGMTADELAVQAAGAAAAEQMMADVAGEVGEALTEEAAAAEQLAGTAAQMVGEMEAMGGVSQATEDDLQHIRDAINEAIQAYVDLGKKAPEALQEVQKATANVKPPESPGGAEGFIGGIAKFVGGGLEQGIGKITGAFSKLATEGFGAVVTAAAGFVTGFLAIEAILGAVSKAWNTFTGFIKGSIAEYAEAEDAINSLGIAMKQMGEGSEAALESNMAVAKKYADQSLYTTNQITQAMTTLTQLGEVTPAQMDAVMGAVTEFAAISGKGIEGSAMIMQRAMDGNFAALKKYGIHITEAQFKAEGFGAVVKAMAEYQGTAAAKTDTLNGRLTQMSKQWADAKEEIGKIIVTSEEFQGALYGIEQALKLVVWGVTHWKDALVLLKPEVAWMIDNWNLIKWAIPGAPALDNMLETLRALNKERKEQQWWDEQQAKDQGAPTAVFGPGVTAGMREALEAANKEIEKAQRALIPLTDAQIKSAMAWDKMGVSIGAMSAKLGVTEAQIQNSLAPVKALEDATAHLTLEQGLAAEKLLNLGMASAEVARTLGFNAAAVERLDISLDKIAAKTTTFTGEQTRAIIEMTRWGFSAQEISARFGEMGLGINVSAEAIAKFIENAGGLPTVTQAMNGLREAITSVAAQQDALSQKAFDKQIAAYMDYADTVQAIQDEIYLHGTEGDTRRLRELEIAKRKELDAHLWMKEILPAEYADLVKRISQKYDVLVADVTAGSNDIVAVMRKMGVKTQEELTATAETAFNNWDAMRQAGVYTPEQIAAAWQQYFAAHEAATGHQLTNWRATQAAMLDGLAGLFDALSEIKAGMGGNLGEGGVGSLFGSMGKMVTGFKQTQAAMRQTGIDGKELGGNFGNLSVAFNSNAKGVDRMASGFASAQAAVQGGIDIWNKTGEAASRGAATMQGAMAGATAGMQVAGPWGAAVGAGVGAIVGVMRNPGWRAATKEIARDWGVEITKELAKSISDTAKEEFGGSRQAAAIFHLDEIVAEAGGLNAENIGAMTAKLHDVFSMMEMGTFDAAQATEVLEKNWQQFAEAGTDATGRLSKELKEIIALTEREGLTVKAVTDYMQGQAAVAGSAFSAIVGVVTEPWIEIGDRVTKTGDAIEDFNKKAADELAAFNEKAQKEIDALLVKQAAGTDVSRELADIEKKRLEVTADGYEELAKLSDAHNEALRYQTEQAGLAGQALADLGVIAVATYGAAIEKGMTHGEAMALALPGLQQLGKAYESLGLDIEDAGVAALVLQAQLMEKTPQLIQGIDALSGSFIALDNMGQLNAETFSALQRTGMTMFARLQGEVAAFGGTQADALVPMQDYLHQAAKQAELLGIPLDENTQELITQSQWLGIWQEEGQSATEQMVEGIQELNKTMVNLVEIFRHQFPAAAAAAAAAVADFADEAGPALQGVADDVNGIIQMQSPTGLEGIIEYAKRAGISMQAMGAMSVTTVRAAAANVGLFAEELDYAAAHADAAHSTMSDWFNATEDYTNVVFKLNDAFTDTTSTVSDAYAAVLDLAFGGGEGLGEMEDEARAVAEALEGIAGVTIGGNIKAAAEALRDLRRDDLAAAVELGRTQFGGGSTGLEGKLPALTRELRLMALPDVEGAEGLQHTLRELGDQMQDEIAALGPDPITYQEQWQAAVAILEQQLEFMLEDLALARKDAIDAIGPIPADYAAAYAEALVGLDEDLADTLETIAEGRDEAIERLGEVPEAYAASYREALDTLNEELAESQQKLVADRAKAIAGIGDLIQKEAQEVADAAGSIPAQYALNYADALEALDADLAESQAKLTQAHGKDVARLADIAREMNMTKSEALDFLNTKYTDEAAAEQKRHDEEVKKLGLTPDLYETAYDKALLTVNATYDEMEANLLIKHEDEVGKLGELPEVYALTYQANLDKVNEKFDAMIVKANEKHDNEVKKLGLLPADYEAAYTLAVDAINLQYDAMENRAIAKFDREVDELGLLPDEYAATYDEIVGLIQQKYVAMSTSAAKEAGVAIDAWKAVRDFYKEAFGYDIGDYAAKFPGGAGAGLGSAVGGGGGGTITLDQAAAMVQAAAQSQLGRPLTQDELNTLQGAYSGPMTEAGVSAFISSGAAARALGYQEGTMGEHGAWWANFGTATPAELHGTEAVVTPAQAPAFAESVIGGGGVDMDGVQSEVAGLREEMKAAERRRDATLVQMVTTAVRDQAQMGWRR